MAAANIFLCTTRKLEMTVAGGAYMARLREDGAQGESFSSPYAVELLCSLHVPL